MTDILEGLTDAQREAVTHINGPLLVVAGPGSGKTRVISRRVAYLVHCGIRPWNILAITFTNKAAGEMRDRVAALVQQKGVWLSTFHSFAARVLREFAERVGRTKSFTIYDSEDSRKAVSGVLKALEMPAENFPPRKVLSAISNAKSRFTTPEQMAEGADDFFLEKVAKVYAAYEDLLRDANALDFDDLLMKTAHLLRSDEDALARLRKRHQFVLVDEFQDTSRSQYIIASLISLEHRNLCVTGDPDQSIYGWRGADITNILDFEKDFPETKAVFLDRNYRSTKTILSAANSLVAKNVQRKERELYTENPKGDRIRLVEATDSHGEAEIIVETARALIAGGTAPRDIAVFYRVNALSREIEEGFVGAGLPYQIVGGVEFYGRREVKDILSYLTLAANGRDVASFARAVGAPKRGIGPKTVEAVSKVALQAGVSIAEAVSSDELRKKLPARAAGTLEEFSEVIEAVTKAGAKSARGAVEAAIEKSGYRMMLLATGEKEDKERLENLEELVNAAAQYDIEETEEQINPLEGFLARAALVGDIDNWHDRENRITLMTMHAAKGLEFPVVMVAGLEEGILPHVNSHGAAAAIEEERRVFFVAMTRAKEKLYLFRAENRMLHGLWQYNAPSRFLREIPEELLDMEFAASAGEQAPLLGVWKERRAQTTRRMERKAALPFEQSPPEPRESAPAGLPGVGARVRHAIFGDGIVRSVSRSSIGHKAVVEFRHSGDRKLILEKAGLEILGR